MPDGAHPATAEHRAPCCYDVTDGVATVTLNRPDAMNSLDVATKEALRDAVRAGGRRPGGARACVLTGTGRAFCVGQDLKEHVEILHGASTTRCSAPCRSTTTRSSTALATMAKPVVAAVNGVAAGAGRSLAFACDFRVLADTAGFNLAFAGIALSCDTGSSWTLPRLVGTAKAMELLLLPAHRAGRRGPGARAGDHGRARRRARRRGGRARRPAGRRPDGGLRRDPPRAWPTPPGTTSPSRWRFEAEMMALTGGTEDHAAAVDAFLAKEKPTFTGALSRATVRAASPTTGCRSAAPRSTR